MSQSSLHKYLPPVMVALMIVAMFTVSGWQAYPLVGQSLLQPGSMMARWLGLSTTTSTAQNIRGETTKPVLPSESQNRYRAVSNLSLFGTPQQSAPKQVVQQPVNLPKTNLKLTLRGVLASNGANASALIEGPDRDTESYKVDEALPGNAVLKSVHNDRIVISRNGRLENLFFPETRSNNIEAYTPPAPDEPATPPVPIAGDLNSQMGVPASVSSLRKKQKDRLQDRLKKLRQKLMQR